MKKEVLICYDVENNKMRKKLHQALLDLGLRNIQMSVFWGHLMQAEINAVKILFEDYLNEGIDRAFLTTCKLEKANNGNCKFGYLPGEIEDWPEYGCL